MSNTSAFPGYLRNTKRSVSSISTTRHAEPLSSAVSRPIPVIGDIEKGEDEQIVENMKLKPDHLNRPLWVCADGRIFFESGLFPDIANPVSEFLVAIAEPLCRPKFIHQYQITVFSLYAAISLGMSASEILDNLKKFAKNELDSKLSDYITNHGSRIGKLRLVLRRKRYFVESSEEQLIKTIEQFHKIQPHVIGPMEKVGEDTWSLEIDPLAVEKVKEAAYRDLQTPFLEEYEFKGDSDLAQIEMALRPTTKLRPYQEKSLHKMFSGKRARCALIVLPCGAGKSLTGITAACTMKCRTMVLTTTAVAVDQWKRQFEMFVAMDPADVITLTADNKQPLPDDRPCILISTYSIFAHSMEHMSRSSAAVMQQVRDLEWGLLIVDEVQVMPAKTFRQVSTIVKAHCKLGLTATLVREDDLIEDLQYLTGPKLYEANWQELEEKGYIAKVQCVEVWCEMTLPFWGAYLNTSSGFVQRSLYTANPRKLTACEYLVRLHEQRGDKVIVFCDNISLLKDMARRTKKPFICVDLETALRASPTMAEMYKGTQYEEGRSSLKSYDRAPFAYLTATARDIIFSCPSLEFAAAMRDRGNKVFFYNLAIDVWKGTIFYNVDMKSAGARDGGPVAIADLGVFHGADIPLVFKLFKSRPTHPGDVNLFGLFNLFTGNQTSKPDDALHKVADAMGCFWSNLAKCGDVVCENNHQCHGQTLPTWAPLKGTDHHYLNFGPDGELEIKQHQKNGFAGVGANLPTTQQCQAWDDAEFKYLNIHHHNQQRHQYS